MKLQGFLVIILISETFICALKINWKIDKSGSCKDLSFLMLVYRLFK